MRVAAPSAHNNELRLLEARIAEGRGDNDAAVAAYRALLPVFVGLEARFRYAELLSRLGRHEAAIEVYNDLIVHSKRFASTHDEEQQWVAAARRAIAS